VQALRDGRGEFAAEGEFYKFWRAYPFRVPKAVERQLEKALEARMRQVPLSVLALPPEPLEVDE